jgi:drug/metabolite transporter (DMT)-like permease
VTPLVFAAALLSALLHALWNAAARSRPEPGLALACVVITAGCLTAPGLLWLGLPPGKALVWLGLGAAFNLVTMRAMMATFRRTPFALGYPLVRGVAPLGVTLIGWAAFGDRVSAPAFAGIVAISTGVLLLAASARRGERVDRVGVGLAILAGFANALFVVTDAQGVRATGDPLVYGFAVSVVNGITMAALLTLEGPGLRRAYKGNLAFSAVASVMSNGSYLLVLYGFTHGPIGAVSALRELSIFFGVVIAAVWLREPVGWMRWTAALVALGGVAAIRLG